MVRSLEEAAAWIDRVGLALLFPKADVVLPSLWEQVNGSPEQNWAIRDPDGGFVRWSEQMAFLWGAKDDLPAAGLVCVGKHLRAGLGLRRAAPPARRSSPRERMQRRKASRRRSWR